MPSIEACRQHANKGVARTCRVHGLDLECWNPQAIAIWKNRLAPVSPAGDDYRESVVGREDAAFPGKIVRAGEHCRLVLVKDKDIDTFKERGREWPGGGEVQDHARAGRLGAHGE
jgi:hypothetical protein